MFIEGSLPLIGQNTESSFLIGQWGVSVCLNWLKNYYTMYVPLSWFTCAIRLHWVPPVCDIICLHKTILLQNWLKLYPEPTLFSLVATWDQCSSAVKWPVTSASVAWHGHCVLCSIAELPPGKIGLVLSQWRLQSEACVSDKHHPQSDN